MSHPGKHRCYPPILDSPSIPPTNAANALLNLTFPQPTGIRSLPPVKPLAPDLNSMSLGYEASDSFRHSSLISTGWNEAGFTATSSTVKVAYSCRIGLASNLAATAASTGWTEAGSWPSNLEISLPSDTLLRLPQGCTVIEIPEFGGMHITSSTVQASYSCRIGLASNLASTVAIANPIHYASF